MNRIPCLNARLSTCLGQHRIHSCVRKPDGLIRNRVKFMKYVLFFTLDEYQKLSNFSIENSCFLWLELQGKSYPLTFKTICCIGGLPVIPPTQKQEWPLPTGQNAGIKAYLNYSEKKGKIVFVVKVPK